MKIDVPQTLAAWNERGTAYLPGLLGMEFTKVEPDEVVGRFMVSRAHSAWNGFLHAGAVVSLADTCCGYGTLKALPDGADGFTTVDLASNFVGTARDDTVTCTARPLHQGRTTQVWDATVTSDASGKAIAHFRCTQMILWPRG